MIAPLHDTHGTENTPIYDAVQRDLAGREARNIVRAGLRVYTNREAQMRAANRVNGDTRFAGIRVLEAVTSNA